MQFTVLTGGKKGTGLSSKTVTDVLSLIRSILKFAIQKGKAVACDGSNIHIKQTLKPMRILSKAEQKKLFQYLWLETSALVCWRLREKYSLRPNTSGVLSTSTAMSSLQRLAPR